MLEQAGCEVTRPGANRTSSIVASDGDDRPIQPRESLELLIIPSELLYRIWWRKRRAIIVILACYVASPILLSKSADMFDNLRDDIRVHGWRLSNRAIWALAVYRFGRWSLERKFPPCRWLTGKIYGCLQLLSEILTGVTLDRHVQVGKGFHLIHCDGPISFHPDAVIGKRCGIMHNVTIGTNMSEGAPTIGDDVFIGVGACLLGKIKIGNRVRIAANTLVMNDIPDDSVAIGVPAKTYKRLGAAAPAAPAERDGLASSSPNP